MEYTFSWSWFFLGLLITIAGACLTLYYRPLADNIGGGVGSYDRYRLAGLIACGVGLMMMLNLHTLILGWILGMIFNR